MLAGQDIPPDHETKIHSNRETYCDETLSNACTLFIPKGQNPLYSWEDCTYGFSLSHQHNRCYFIHNDYFEKSLQITGCVFGMSLNMNKCEMEHCKGLCGLNRLYDINTNICTENKNIKVYVFDYMPEIQDDKKIINTKDYCYVGFVGFDVLTILIHFDKKIVGYESVMSDLNAILTKAFLYFYVFNSIRRIDDASKIRCDFLKFCIKKSIRDYFVLGDKFKSVLNRIEDKKRTLEEEYDILLKNYKEEDIGYTIGLYILKNDDGLKTDENSFYIYYQDPNELRYIEIKKP